MSLPPLLLKSLQTAAGFDEEKFIAIHNSGQQVTSIRINPAKNYNQPNVLLSLSKDGAQSTKIQNVNNQKVPWSTHGYYLSARPSFTLDPAFHAGAYYVQEASSMFLEVVLQQTTNINQRLRILDLCAAPGGKSTLIQSLITDESLLVSNEIIKARVNVLLENITKWGAPNVIVTNNAAKDFQRQQNYFDVIVVDAPCSGSGLFRKDPEAMKEWSPANVEMCSLRQKNILQDVLPALKPGGTLIYSTCSYSEIENDAIADWLGDQHLIPQPIVLQPEWNIVENFSKKHHAPGYRFYPDKLKGEGFYISAFKKQDQFEKAVHFPKPKWNLLKKNELNLVNSYVEKPEDFQFVNFQNEVLAIPKNSLGDIALLQSNLYIRKAGVKMGAIKNNSFIPDHALAASTILKDGLPSVALAEEDALNYLRRKDFNVNTHHKGWLLVTFNGHALGWIKNIGNRINNYYPKAWRIINK
ncbi:MAG: RNA methyltransferase [Ferruginibacter sp.]